MILHLEELYDQVAAVIKTCLPTSMIAILKTGIVRRFQINSDKSRVERVV